MAVRLWRPFQALGGDVRYAVRVIRRSPGFTAAAVFILALSIGANAAVFSLINALLLRPLPVHAPSELAFIYPGQPDAPLAVSHAEARSFAENTSLLRGVTTTSHDSAADDAAGGAVTLLGESVSPNYFDLLGLRASMGRVLADADDLPGAPPAVVISDRMWRRQFNADPNILGRLMSLRRPSDADSGWRYAIVGVMGPEFVGVRSPWESTDFWAPARQRIQEAPVLIDPIDPDSRLVGVVIARRQTGVSIAQVQSFVDVRHRSYAQERRSPAFADLKQALVVRDSIRFSLPMDVGNRIEPARLGVALMGVAGLILVIGIANLAGVTIARGVVRGPEIAVRLSLGASRSRVGRQLVVEGLIVSFAGAIGALFASQWLVALFLANIPDGFGAANVNVSVDIRVVMVTALMAVISGLFIGLGPARQAWRTDLLTALGTGAHAAPRKARARLRHFIVVPQIALSLALLIVAGLAAREVMKVALVEPGYDPARAATLMFNPNLRPHYRAGQSRDERRAAAVAENARAILKSERVLEMMRAEPSIEFAAFATAFPWTSGADGAPIAIRDGFLKDGPRRRGSVTYATPGFFEALGLPLRRGRLFDDRDTGAVRTAIVDESMARLLWNGADPLGGYVAVHQAGSNNEPDWHEVIGVVGDVRHPLSEGDVQPTLYLGVDAPNSDGQHVRSAWLSLIARGRGADDLVQTMRRVVTTVDPAMQLQGPRAVGESIDRVRYPRRVGVALLGSSAAIGVLLACLGLYSIVSYSVARRTKELGIRAVLGADSGRIARLVLREGSVVVVLGMAFGIALAFTGVGVVSHYVFPIPGLDLLTVAAVSSVLGAIVLLACYLPARRAARTDPMVALRYE